MDFQEFHSDKAFGFMKESMDDMEANGSLRIMDRVAFAWAHKRVSDESPSYEIQAFKTAAWYTVKDTSIAGFRVADVYSHEDFEKDIVIAGIVMAGAALATTLLLVALVVTLWRLTQQGPFYWLF